MVKNRRRDCEASPLVVLPTSGGAKASTQAMNAAVCRPQAPKNAEPGTHKPVTWPELSHCTPSQVVHTGVEGFQLVRRLLRSMLPLSSSSWLSWPLCSPELTGTPVHARAQPSTRALDMHVSLQLDLEADCTQECLRAVTHTSPQRLEHLRSSLPHTSYAAGTFGA